MRFERDLVHPTIFAASDKIVQRFWNTGGFQGTPEQAQAFADHQAIWQKEYGWNVLLGTVLCIASFAGLASLPAPLGALPHGLAFVALLAFWTSVAVAAYRRNLRTMTVAELKAIAPAMDLTPIQRVYTDALVAAAELKLPDDQYREIVGQLNRLLDEEARLNALRERGAGSPATQEEILRDRARIVARMEATTDSVAREALARSLEIADSRLRAAQELSLVGQRVEAQLEMIGQAIRGIRDSLLRLQTAPAASPRVDLDAVRQTVDLAQYHSQALEQAVEEVRTLA
jgi:hypothetical protein